MYYLQYVKVSRTKRLSTGDHRVLKLNVLLIFTEKDLGKTYAVFRREGYLFWR